MTALEHKDDRRIRLGEGRIFLKLLVAFFWFGAAMCTLTVLALGLPEFFGWIWRIKPETRDDFAAIGGYAFWLMSIVGLACAGAAIGLARRAPWGRVLALIILCVNLLGDSLGAFLRHDYRTLIGLPIGGAMIYYLVKSAGKFRLTSG